MPVSPVGPARTGRIASRIASGKRAAILRGLVSPLKLFARPAVRGGEDVLQVTPGVAYCDVSHYFGSGPRST
jgi:hypothetical protein